MGKDEEGGVAVLRRLTKTQIHANLDRQDCEFILGQFLRVAAESVAALSAWRAWEMNRRKLARISRLLLCFWACLAVLLAWQGMSVAAASKIPPDADVAVLGFGKLGKSATSGVNLDETAGAIGEYVLEAVTEQSGFALVDNAEAAEAEAELARGEINANTLMAAGRKLGARYVIYGRITALGTGEDGASLAFVGYDKHSVTADLILRMLDVETGRVLVMSKGQGKSSSAAGGIVPVVALGTVNVTQESVDSALEKAAGQAVEKMLKRLGLAAKKDLPH